MRVCPECQLTYHDDAERCVVDGASLEAATDPLIGAVLAGKYVIADVIGEGGMATVYGARHNLVERPCAIKVLHPVLAGDHRLRERLLREARSTAALAHPNIVEIYDFGETEDNRPFLVMELLHGHSLRELIQEGGMEPHQVVALGLQIARGLARAHDFGVVHRDLKPENIFVVEDDEGQALIKVMDFGIARASKEDSRLTATGEIIGTPQYIAPERITSLESLPPSDLYSLGVLFFEMLTGRLPFQSRSVAGYLVAHMQNEPPRPSELSNRCPPPLEDLILSLLAKDPKDRPVDAHQAVRLLTELLPGRRSLKPRHTSKRIVLREKTLTLERWMGRTALFSEMLERAYPKGDAPRYLRQAFADLLTGVERMKELRGQAMKAQRDLQSLEQEAREGRERLGHAVHVLAVDLSRAREDARQSQGTADARELEVAAARESFRRADQDLGALRADEPPIQPTARNLDDARRLADSVDDWQRWGAHAASARASCESKESEVADLVYQVEALGQQLHRLEMSIGERGKASQALLQENGDERGRIERRMAELAADFCRPLRDRQDLTPLFTQLDTAL